MNQQQPQLYNSLTSALGPEEQQVIKAAMETADKSAAQQEQVAAQAATGQAQADSAQSPHTNGAS